MRTQPLASLKSPRQVVRMREAGRVARAALDAALAAAVPGATTADVDRAAEAALRAQGGTPEFKGYQGFPAASCVSVNDEVVHGVPGGRVLHAGDLVSVDVGARVGGWVGDNAASLVVGDPSGGRPGAAADLCRAARECLERAVRLCRPGARLSEIGRAVERHARSRGYRVVREYTGHGIGTRLHEEPRVPNHETPASFDDLELEEGMCLAVEPMLVAGRADVRVRDDGWTVVTRDGSWAAHWEDVVAVTSDGPLVLTRP